MMYRFINLIITLAPLATVLCNAKVLWSSTSATNYSNIIREAYLLGNGRLGGNVSATEASGAG